MHTAYQTHVTSVMVHPYEPLSGDKYFLEGQCYGDLVINRLISQTMGYEENSEGGKCKGQ